VVAKLQRGTPYLLTEHGVYLREQYLNLRRNIASSFVRWFLYRLVGAVVAVNYHFADQISLVCAYNKRWELWRGVPSQKMRPLIVTMGLIFPLKGQLDLIEASAIIRSEVPDVEVQIYGSASNESYFQQCRERATALDLGRTVVFCGSTNDPCKAYCEADVVAFASVSEAFPYAVIEAMLAGAAVVATDVGGVAEAIGETGVLVRPRQPKELAKAVTALLRSAPERARLGEKARSRALRLFTEPTFLQEYKESYLRLATVNELALARWEN
jgi:glycosyltransferase involved in cell wall biosynthesis